MELRQLNYFVTVAKTLNFSDAAKKLFITQGTLSQQIRKLEEEIDTPLFYRTSHSVLLTEAGAEMLPIAQKAIDASSECLLKVQDLKKVLSGTLSIGLTSSFKRLMAGTVRRFISKYPGVKMKICYKPAIELIDMLEAGDIDFMLAFKPAAAYDCLDSEVLFTSTLSAVMHSSHPLAGSKSLSMQDLKRQKLVIPGSGMQARRAFERFVDLDTSDLNIVMELNDPDIILSLLHDTELISIVSSFATSYDPSLVAIPLTDAQRKMTGCVHWLRGGYRKKSALRFVEMLRESQYLSEC